MLRENTPKLTLFGLLFTQVLMQEKIIEMVFFLNYRQHKKRPKFWIYDNIKAYLKDFFFERLCLAWKVSKENIIFIPFLGLVKSLIKGDHFWPFFWRFCVKKNAGTDPVHPNLWPQVVADQVDTSRSSQSRSTAEQSPVFHRHRVWVYRQPLN